MLIHGFTGVPIHFRLLARFLNDHGYTVVAPLLAGHGTSIDDMAGTGASDWMASARAGADCDAERIHLVGLSMGGLLALQLASETAAASVTTINAPIRFRDRQIYITPIVHRFMPRIRRTVDTSIPFDREAAGLWITYDGFPTRAAAEMLKLSRRAIKSAKRLRRPSLIVQSLVDEAVDPHSGERLRRALGPRCRLLWLNRSRHNALLDVERDIIHAAVLDVISHA